MLTGAEVPVTSPKRAPAVAPSGGGGGSSWLDSVLNDIDSDPVIQTDNSSNPFSVPSTTPTNANSTRSAKPVTLPSPKPFRSSPDAANGGDDDELLAQLAASEDRLNAARAGAAIGSQSAATVHRMLGPQSGQTVAGNGSSAS